MDFFHPLSDWICMPIKHLRSSCAGSLPRLGLWFAVAISSSLGPTQAATLPVPPDPYNYKIVDQDIQAVLRQFGTQLGVRTNIDPSIEGRVVDEEPEGLPEQFLGKLGEQYNFEWYYDGQVLHVTPSQATVSRVITLNVVSLERLTESLRALDIYDERFPIKPTPNSDVALVTGPPRFVSLVENSLAALAEVQPPQPPATTIVRTPAPRALPQQREIPRPLVVYRGSSVQVLPGGRAQPRQEAPASTGQNDESGNSDSATN